MIVARVKDDYRFPIFSTPFQDFVKDEWRQVIDDGYSQSAYGDYLEFDDVDESEMATAVEANEGSYLTKDQVLAMTMPQLKMTAKDLGLTQRPSMSKSELVHMILQLVDPEEPAND